MKELGQPGNLPRESSWPIAQPGSVGSRRVFAEWPPTSVAGAPAQGSLQEGGDPQTIRKRSAEGARDGHPRASSLSGLQMGKVRLAEIPWSCKAERFYLTLTRAQSQVSLKSCLFSQKRGRLAGLLCCHLGLSSGQSHHLSRRRPAGGDITLCFRAPLWLWLLEPGFCNLRSWGKATELGFTPRRGNTTPPL